MRISFVNILWATWQHLIAFLWLVHDSLAHVTNTGDGDIDTTLSISACEMICFRDDLFITLSWVTRTITWAQAGVQWPVAIIALCWLPLRPTALSCLGSCKYATTGGTMSSSSLTQHDQMQHHVVFSSSRQAFTISASTTIVYGTNAWET